MRTIRRKEKEIRDKNEVLSILEQVQYITIAMSRDNEPYLVTLSHGYDREQNCIYFHCAKEGKKIDILSVNNNVWGQALIDKGYVQGACDHLYATVHFMGRVNFSESFEEKRHAFEIMIKALDDNPASLIKKQLTKKSITDVNIGRIDIEHITGKKSEKVIISL
ncbi:MAG: pyridoxamine 5'-phosphate oxidase family protein [Candidatus Aminicenantes bacterium]|nr:MAG: pyridoxamine 5'-phosphate oxidase family protein [Candidatus Aminicenantes bacterium]